MTLQIFLHFFHHKFVTFLQSTSLPQPPLPQPTAHRRCATPPEAESDRTLRTSSPIAVVAEPDRALQTSSPIAVVAEPDRALQTTSPIAVVAEPDRALLTSSPIAVVAEPDRASGHVFS